MGSPQACTSQYAMLLKNMHFEIELQFPYYRTDPSARLDWTKCSNAIRVKVLDF